MRKRFVPKMKHSQNKKILVSHKKMAKLLNKGVVGAMTYVQKLQLEENTKASLPELSGILQGFDDMIVG
jgi:hypothetical protein